MWKQHFNVALGLVFFLFWSLRELQQWLYFVRSKGGICVRREEKGISFSVRSDLTFLAENARLNCNRKSIVRCRTFQRLSANVQRSAKNPHLNSFFFFAFIHMHMIPASSPLSSPLSLHECQRGPHNGSAAKPLKAKKKQEFRRISWKKW